MIEEGSIIKIGDKEGIICFITNLNDQMYANVCFEEGEEEEYKIYKVENDSGRYRFILEQNPNTLSQLTYEFVMTVAGEND